MSAEKARAFALARAGDRAGLDVWRAAMTTAGRTREATDILQEIVDAGLDSVAEHRRVS